MKRAKVRILRPICRLKYFRDVYRYVFAVVFMKFDSNYALWIVNLSMVPILKWHKVRFYILSSLIITESMVGLKVGLTGQILSNRIDSKIIVISVVCSGFFFN